MSSVMFAFKSVIYLDQAELRLGRVVVWIWKHRQYTSSALGATSSSMAVNRSASATTKKEVERKGERQTVHCWCNKNKSKHKLGLSVVAKL